MNPLISKKKMADEELKPHDRCHNCGYWITTTTVETTFPYGAGEDCVLLKATVPLRSCHNCDIEYFDFEAEDLQQAAVDRHLASKQ